MDISAFRQAGHEAIERIACYYEGLQSNSMPVTVPSEPGLLRKHISAGPPRKGEAFSTITKDFEELILPGCTHWQHPAFLGFFPANTTFESIIADMYSSAIGNPGFNWECSPIATDLEFIVMDWVADFLGLNDMYKSASKTGGGIIMGTSSEAFLTMCVASRERAMTYVNIKSTVSDDKTNETERELNDATGKWSPDAKTSSMDTTRTENKSAKFVMYGSTEAHSMGSKAAKILGLTWKSITVTGEDGWKLTGKALRKTLEEDVSNALVPCMLLVSLGATNLGTIDCLEELVEVANDYPSLWVHVDAAWAGSYMGLEECRQELHLDVINKPPSENHFLKTGDVNQQSYYVQQPPGIVHSFCTNLHKSGLVGFECTTNFVRNKYLIIDSIEQSQPCLESSEGHADRAVDLRNWEIPLGRRFRSLKVYFVLRSYGIEGFRKELQRTIEIATSFECLIRNSKLFETVVPRSLALVVFRMKPILDMPTEDFGDDIEDICNLQSQELAKSLSETHNVYLTSSTLEGKFCLRIAVGRWTRRDHVEEIWKLLLENAEAVLVRGKAARQLESQCAQRSCLRG